MRKINQKGFMLMETLLVSVFVVSTLLFLYVQFGKVRSGYQSSFHYNTVGAIYSAGSFLEYLKENGIENLSTTMDTTDSAYIDLTSCPASYLSSTAMCSTLITKLNIKKIYYVSSDLTKFKQNMPAGISGSLKNYVKTIKGDGIGYRLLIEYKDQTFASILARGNGTTGDSGVVKTYKKYEDGTAIYYNPTTGKKMYQW